MIQPPKSYANLGELMLFENANGANHPADDIAAAWKTWVTEGDLLWYTDDIMYVVPSMFMTDFASIPAAFRWLLTSNSAPWQLAGVLHDFLYSSTTVSRKEADRAYYYLARAAGTVHWRAAIMYVALRVGGFMAYRKNQQRLEREGPRWRFLDANENE